MEEEKLKEKLSLVVIDDAWVITLARVLTHFLRSVMEFCNVDPMTVVMALAMTLKDVLDRWEKEGEGDGNPSDA